MYGSKCSSTRSISLDLFELRRKQNDYYKHRRKLQEIQGNNHILQKHAKQIDKVTQQLHRRKQAARKFKTLQQNRQRKQQDQCMIKNIINQTTTRHFPTFKNSLAIQNNKRAVRQRQKNEIFEENQKIIMHILDQDVNVKEYKKKLAADMKQYLDMRNHLTRFKTVKMLTQASQRQFSESKKKKMKSTRCCISERRLLTDEHAIFNEQQSLIKQKY